MVLRVRTDRADRRDDVPDYTFMKSAEPHPSLPSRLRCLPGKEFWGIHVAALGGVLITGWSWSGLLLAIGLYFARMAFVCIAYHRYFAHRAFKTSRAFQFVLAFLAQTSVQKGALWWAAHHRHHHRHSDTP